MKKIVLALTLLTLLITSYPVQGQDYFRDKVNISVFGGRFAEQQNANNNGQYLGLYVDYLALKTYSGWSLGPYILVNNSGFTKNLIPYTSKSMEMGGGMTLGYYNEFFTASHRMFTGLSIGYKHNEENGESLVHSGPKKGHYVGHQSDNMLSVALNANLMKSWGLRPDLFPRSQIILNFQKPLFSEKETFWNEEEIIPSSKPWDKTYYDATFKQSIVNWTWGSKLFCSPKTTLNYAYSAGAAKNSRSYYAFGLELSWHKPDKDDFMILNLLYRFNDIPGKQSLVFGASINVGSLISK